MANVKVQMAELKQEVERLREAVETVRLADRAKIVEVVRDFLDDLQAGRVEIEALRGEVKQARAENERIWMGVQNAKAALDEQLDMHKEMVRDTLDGALDDLRGYLKQLFATWAAAAAQQVGGTKKLADQARTATKDSVDAVKEVREELTKLRTEVVDIRALQDGLRTDVGDGIRQLQIEVFKKLTALQQYERLNRAALAKIAEPKLDEEKGWLKKLLGR